MPTGKNQAQKRAATIRRAPHSISEQYCITRRATAQDNALSFEARGLLWYLLSKPDDWKVIPADLMREGKCGRERINRILDELIQHGYLTKNDQQPHSGKGHFAPNLYFVNEAPLGQKPSTVEPSTVNLPTYKVEIEQNTESINGAGAPGVQPKSGKPRPRDEMIDVIAQWGFNVPPTRKLGRDTGGRCGRLKREIGESFPEITPADVAAAYWWDRKCNPKRDRPNTGATVTKMLSTWVESGRKPIPQSNQRPVVVSSVPDIIPDLPEPLVDHRGVYIGANATT